MPPETSTVQVPARILKSLVDAVTSINDLRDSVSQLRSENETLRQELSAVKSDLIKLQQNSGVRFPQFQKLAVELRRFVLVPVLQLIYC